MKLDNVDLAKLKLADIPKFNKCLCELCDDGCFEKSGKEHHLECRHRLPQRTKLPLAARCPLSHYQGTFLPTASISDDHRRQPCPAAPDNEIPISFKNVPMSSISVQKEHYPPPPSGVTKQKPVAPPKQTDRFIVSAGAVPMETQTHYQTEYIEKPVVTTAHRSAKDAAKASQVNITDPSAHISSKTTSHSHFKSWQPVSTHPYTEMPAVVGHVLFPDASRSFDTTSGRTYVPHSNISPPKPIFRPEYDGNLKASGTMDLRTNYRQQYSTPKLSTTRSAPIKTADAPNEQKVYTRRPMNGISQTTFDFRPYLNHRPPHAFDMEPFLSQINIGDSSIPVTKDTQYRLDYPGHDTNQHHRPPAVEPKDKQPYVPPVEKMDSLTVTQRDFQPIDVTALPRIRSMPLKSMLSISDQTGPMESVTMSRYHYQPYEPMISKRRYGELIPNIYIPPTDKFEGTTTTGDTYQGRSGKPARAYIPEIRVIKHKGKYDHNTNYRMDYHPHGLSLCAAKAYTIAQNKEANPTSVSIQ